MVYIIGVISWPTRAEGRTYEQSSLLFFSLPLPPTDSSTNISGPVTFNGIKIPSISLVNYVKDTVLSTSPCRRGSTPVSTVLRKSLRFFINNRFPGWNLANLKSEWLRNPGKVTQGIQNPPKFPWGACPPDLPLEPCFFGARLGNLSVLQS